MGARIVERFDAGRSPEGVLAHLERSRGWANVIVAEAVARGIPESRIGPWVGRPDSSAAKLIDGYLNQVDGQPQRVRYPFVTGQLGRRGI